METDIMTNPDAVWQPHCTLDLAVARGKAFEELVVQFDDWVRAEPLVEALGLANGWHTITPQVAEQLLRRNRPGANRKAVLSTIAYYAMQMQQGDWPKTGEPIIFSDGVLIDGQHRLWAAYLSGCSFTTYVVADVPVHPQLFAYIDNGKSRTAANALQTAGLNGVSTLLAKVLDMSYNYDHGYLTAGSVRSHARMAPIWYLRAVEAQPNARKAARLAISDHQAASDLIDREVVAFAIKVILDLHGDDAVDGFFTEVVADGVDDANPAAQLRLLLQKDALKSANQMKRHVKLGNLIIAFNAWLRDETLRRRWALAAHEDFPAFAPAVLSAAAE